MAKRALFVAVVVLIVAAYFAGYFPEHRRVTEANGQLQSLQQRLAAAEARVRLGALLGQLLHLSDAVEARNYGQAAAISSSYFDLMREDMAQADGGDVKQTLERMLQTRDQITAALARTDPSVAATLRDQQLSLRRTLGYPVDIGK